MSEESKPTIQSIRRAATILSAFSVSNPRLTLNQLTATLGTTKATAHRYTMALREAKLVRYSERDTLFSLGPEILPLAAAARAGMPIIATAAPLIHELVRELNETVVLSLWDGSTAVVVHVDDSTDAVIRVSVRTGARLDLEHSAQGRVFCAFLNAEDEPAVAAALDGSSELRAHVAEIRESGVATNTESLTGVRVVAVPVTRHGAAVAAVAVVGTAATVPEDHRSRVALRLREVADLITKDADLVDAH